MKPQRERIMGQHKSAKGKIDKPAKSHKPEEGDDAFARDAEAIIEGDQADMPALMTKDVSGG
jgi:hypothetical protein